MDKQSSNPVTRQVARALSGEKPTIESLNSRIRFLENKINRMQKKENTIQSQTNYKNYGQINISSSQSTYILLKSMRKNNNN